jgi:hypothetical protein
LAVSCPTRVVVSAGRVIVPTFETLDITGDVRVLLVSVCTAVEVTICSEPIFITPELPLNYIVPNNPGLLPHEVKETDFTLVILSESSMHTSESCNKPPIVLLYLAITLSVDVAGPDTPPISCRF